MADLFPSLRYRDANAAIDFLGRAFGFEPGEVHRDGETVAHAELWHGDNAVMLGSIKGEDDAYGEHAGQGWIYVVVEDADAHCARAREAGAGIVRELMDTDYGSRDYAARDPEGNLWNFGTYRPSRPG